MSSVLDMSLDDMIKTNKQGGRRGGRGGRRGRRGGFRNNNTTGGYAGGPKPNDMYENMVPATVIRPPLGFETGTKLYISNLDYGVSNDDLKELFAEVGELKRCSIHYDRSGRSKGTAEVVFARKAEAVAAMKRYNTVQLDGKPMQIEVIGTIPSTLSGRAPAAAGGAGVMVQAANGARPNPTAQRIVVMGGGTRGRGFGGRRGGGNTFRGRGRGRGAGRGRGRVPVEEKSAEDLDAELETYHAEAMQM
ncbi:unnamed protein product [Sphagnum troendelagicum]|uniref:RRM domain-containing protein n=1 Tax=Sphagnum troendelagicum TaxID=128251 RepID=A0ABP0UD64_9BRYO